MQPLDCFYSDVQRLEAEFKQEEKDQRRLVILQTLEGIMELAVEGKDERMLALCRPLCMQLVEYLPLEKQSLVLQILSYVAQTERENTRQRQREGIAAAKGQGRYKGRKPIEPPGLDAVIRRWRAGELTAAEAMRKLNLSPSTFYRKAKRVAG